MGIKYRSVREPELAAATSAAVGKVEAKKQEQQIDWKRESEIRANQLKMEMQEAEIRQQFLNEQRRKQIEIDRETRAHEWETEKMELRSRNDFAKEEEERQKASTEFENQIKEIDKQAAERGWTEKHPDVWNQKVQAALKVEKYNLREPNRILGIERALELERKEAERLQRQLPRTTLSPTQMIEAAKQLEKLSPEEQERVWIAWPPFKPRPLTQTQKDVKAYLEHQISETRKRTTPLTDEIIPKKLDKNTAAQILREANGDKDLAREIARSRGYVF